MLIFEIARRQNRIVFIRAVFRRCLRFFRLDGDADVPPTSPELAQPSDHTAVPGSLTFSLGTLASQNAVAQRLGSNQPSFICELE